MPIENGGIRVGVSARRVVELAVRSERRDLDRKQDVAVGRANGHTGHVAEHRRVLPCPDAGQRVPRVEFRASMNNLVAWTEAAATVAGDTVIDIPVAHTLERIVRWQDTLDPELDIATHVQVDEAKTGMLAPHAIRPALAGANLERSAPRLAVIARAPEVSNVDRIRARPALLNREHVSAAVPRIEGIRHDCDPFCRRSQKCFAPDSRNQLHERG